MNKYSEISRWGISVIIPVRGQILVDYISGNVG